MDWWTDGLVDRWTGGQMDLWIKVDEWMNDPTGIASKDKPVRIAKQRVNALGN